MGSKQRDEQIKERERKISSIRETESSSANANAKDRANWEEQRKLDALDEEERRNRSEVMGQTRAQEAKELLAGRGSEAKKVFQRNSSQGQMNFAGQLRRSNEPKPVVVNKTFQQPPAQNGNTSQPDPR